MILRYDRVGIELPEGSPDATGAMAVQELMGGRFGEMSTLMNYTFQSFNFRGRAELRPFYDLIANIAAEEYGHVEVVAVCKGPHPETGEELVVADEAPEGFPPPEAGPETDVFAPDYAPGDIAEIAQTLRNDAGLA